VGVWVGRWLIVEGLKRHPWTVEVSGTYQMGWTDDHSAETTHCVYPKLALGVVEAESLVLGVHDSHGGLVRGARFAGGCERANRITSMEGESGGNGFVMVHRTRLSTSTLHRLRASTTHPVKSIRP